MVTTIIIILILFIGIIKIRFIIGYVKELNRKKRISVNIAGPTAFPILGNITQLKRNPFDFSAQLIQLSYEFIQKGEHLMRLWIGPKLYVFPLDGETAKPLLESNKEIIKGDDYDFLYKWLGSGLLISKGDKWRSRRKMLTPSFHFNILNGFISTFDTESKVFIEILDKFADINKEIDIFPYVKRCALDIICTTAMGTKINAQLNENSDYVQSVMRFSRLTYEHSMSPWFWFSPFWYATGKGFTTDKTIKTLTDFTNKVIAERTKNFLDGREGFELNTKTLTFLDLLLYMQHENHLTQEDIREEVDTFMFEGHDTTSAGIGWTLWCFATHPNIQQAAADEVHAVFGDGNVIPTVHKLNELKYLERCIKESLRLFPPVPIFERLLSEDIQMGDKIVPRGSNCMLSPMLIHRNPKVFKKAKVFDPDNFLPERIAERHPYSYLPFSAGPRNCIGQKFALLEEKTVLASVLYNFKLSTKWKFSDNRFSHEVILRPEKGFPVLIQRRSHTKTFGAAILVQ